MEMIIFFTRSNDHQKDLIYHEEPADNKPLELRYKNSVYISFRRKVYLAFVAFKEVSEYLNNYLYKVAKIPGIGHSVDIIENTQFGVYSCSIVVSNNKNLYEETKVHGEPKVFEQLFKEVKGIYFEGLELYYNKHSQLSI